ncbi:MAG TPA: PAS domain S-box protein, partial [Methanosarcinales archaeon]|nr:PAS domain S-box protein [Methanosarcinales archaeon]
MDELHKATSEIDVQSLPKICIEKMLKVICNNLGYRFGTVIKADGRVFARCNLPEDCPEQVNKAIAQVLSSLSGEAIKTGRIVVFRDALSDPCLAPWRELIGPYNIKTMVWIPLLSEGRAHGTWVLCDTQIRDVSEEELRTLGQIGAMISIIIPSDQCTDHLDQQTEGPGKEITETICDLQLYSRELIEVSLDPLVTFDAGGIILDVNSATVQATGKSRDELIGTRFADHFTYPERAYSGAMQVFETGQVRDYELMMKAADGRETIVAYNASVYRDLNGDVVGAFAALRDITERKRAEEKIKESEKRLKIILDRLQTGVVIIDAETHKITDINSMAAEIIGAPKEEIVGRVCHKFICPSEVGKCPITDLGQSIDNSEREMINAHGKTIPVLKTVTSITLDAHPYIIDSFIDISDRKRADEEKEALINRLDKMNQKLEQSNKELQDFVYVSSHDLREPLRKILIFGRLLEETLAGKLDDDQQENFEFMIDGANKMQEIVDAVLSYSSVITGAKPSEVVNMNIIIDDLENLELADRLEETAGTIIVPEPLPPVYADPSQVHHLLQHLIVNGLKYHQQGKLPEITIRASELDSMVRAVVEDNGIGIARDHYDDVFTMFRRLHPRKDYEGTGIGLTICKRI